MDGTTRKISEIIEPQAVVEGAGVRLKRSIGTHTLDYLDPFLLLDHFQSKNPADYQAGFPLHPHRGIETVTYLLAGAVRHRDSVGNAGEIGPGDLQWMTAGRGIMHEEMPQVRPEGVSGFQLWVNLPAKQKMIAPHGSFNLPIARGHSAFAYVFEGEGKFGPEDRIVKAPQLIVWDDGDGIQARAEEGAVRFLLVSGKPLDEPIARYGPFVMNTKAEIEQTLRELQAGTFAQ